MILLHCLSVSVLTVKPIKEPHLTLGSFNGNWHQRGQKKSLGVVGETFWVLSLTALLWSGTCSVLLICVGGLGLKIQYRESALPA